MCVGTKNLLQTCRQKALQEKIFYLIGILGKFPCFVLAVLLYSERKILFILRHLCAHCVQISPYLYSAVSKPLAFVAGQHYDTLHCIVYTLW